MGVKSDGLSTSDVLTPLTPSMVKADVAKETTPQGSQCLSYLVVLFAFIIIFTTCGTVYRYGAGTVVYRYRAGTVVYRYGAGTVVYRYRAGTVVYRYGPGTVVYRGMGLVQWCIGMGLVQCCIGMGLVQWCIGVWGWCSGV